MSTEKTEFQVYFYFDEVLRALGAARTAAVNLARSEYDRGVKDELARGDSLELSQVRDLLANTSENAVSERTRLNKPGETAAAVSALLSHNRERTLEVRMLRDSEEAQITGLKARVADLETQCALQRGEFNRLAKFLAVGDSAPLPRERPVDAVMRLLVAERQRRAELEARIEQEDRRACEKLGALDKQIMDLETRCAQQREEIGRLERDLSTARQERNAAAGEGSAWVWSDTDPNYLGSMSAEMVVQMRAEQLRSLLAIKPEERQAVDEWTHRIRVPGGWIYRWETPAYNGSPGGAAMAFVPEPGTEGK